MGNKGATGPFAPLVVAIRNVYGTKNFNLLRGKAISLHSQGRFLEERELQSASKGGRGASECASEEELSGRGRCEKRRGRRRGRRGGRRRRNSRQRDLFHLFLFLTKQLHHFLWKKNSKHTPVIKEFGKSIGVDTKQVQGLIRLAKKNGEKLGFLA